MRVRKEVIAALASTIALLVGCTSTQSLRPHELVGQQVELELTSGHQVDGTAEFAQDGSVVWRTVDGTLVAPHQVLAASKTNRPGGAFQGLGVGLLFGVTTGALLGFLSGDDPPCSGDWFCIRFDASEKAMAGAVGLGGMGSLLGLIVGAIKGKTTIWEWPAQQDKAVSFTVTPIRAGANAQVSITF